MKIENTKFETEDAIKFSNITFIFIFFYFQVVTQKMNKEIKKYRKCFFNTKV